MTDNSNTTHRRIAGCAAREVRGVVVWGGGGRRVVEAVFIGRGIMGGPPATEYAEKTASLRLDP